MPTITLYLPDIETDDQVVEKISYVCSHLTSNLYRKPCQGGFTIRAKDCSIGRYTRKSQLFKFTEYGKGKINHSRITLGQSKRQEAR